MCQMCQMQFLMDHEYPAEGNVPCPGCGRFYVEPEREQCYHCFSQAAGLEPCEICAEEPGARSTPVN
jgi:hypothetical protein